MYASSAYGFERLLLAGRIARNSGLRLVRLVAAAAAAEALKCYVLLAVFITVSSSSFLNRSEGIEMLGETYQRPSRARGRERRCSWRARAGTRAAFVRTEDRRGRMVESTLPVPWTMS